MMSIDSFGHTWSEGAAQVHDPDVCGMCVLRSSPKPIEDMEGWRREYTGYLRMLSVELERRQVAR